MPKAEEFETRGYMLDLPAIVKEVRALLYSGAVPMSRRDVCQGERETLSFGTALQLRLLPRNHTDMSTVVFALGRWCGLGRKHRVLWAVL